GVRAAIGSIEEEIRPGAFAESIASGRDILALVDHDPHALLARTRSGSLRLKEDTRGLAFDLDLPDTSEGRDILALADRDDLGGMSFGFSIPQGGESRTNRVRLLERVSLYEISVIKAFPAYEGTVVSARSRPGDAGLRLDHARRYLEALK
ncbi:MAG: HK97 family phage prohead protease, partial [Spirochaetaceae bacterium]|nr:HK97 family phage prohead protease [Spirochaetaceae bacterium]